MPGQRRDPGADGRVRAVARRGVRTARTPHGARGPSGASPARCEGPVRCEVPYSVRRARRRTEYGTPHGIVRSPHGARERTTSSGANGPAVRRVLSRRLHGGDGHLSRTDVAVGLQRSTRGLGEQPQRPLSDLAPGEVYRADPVTRTPGGLLHHRFTLTDVAAGGLLSVALSRGLLRVGVTHRPALWSPDVPRHSRGSDATVSPTHSQVRVYRPRARPRAGAHPHPRPEVPRSRHVGAHEGAPWNLGAPQTASRGTSAPAAGRVEPHRTPPAPHGAGQCGLDRPTDRRVRRSGQPGSRRR